MTDFDHVKDSGERQEFPTGAVRDAQSGKGRYDLVLSLPHMIYRLARHFENGAVKYGDDNWRKGLPLRRFIDSAFRHLCQHVMGSVDEDHLTAAIWNLMCHGETANEIAAGRLPESLDDMPHYVGGLDPASPEGDESVAHVVDLYEPDPNVEYVDGTPPPFSVEELQQRVKDGELLSDREDAALLAADCGRSHPFVAHTMAGPISCLCDECKNARLKLAVEPPTFYVCGPMTGIEDFNFPLFDQVAELARSQGLSIISPAELDREHGIDPVANPGSVERAHDANPNLLQTIGQRDLEVIVELKKNKGDGFILLPGWEGSTGGRAEVAWAIWMELSFKRVRITWHGQPHEIEIEDIPLGWVKQNLFHQPEIR